MFKAFLFISLLSTHIYAANLGKELQVAINPQDGHYQLGVHYSYETGETGKDFLINWGILFGTTISQQEVTNLPEKLKWNVFNILSNSYLADWNQQSSISGKDILLGSVATDKELAKKIIANQSSVVLVFGDINGNPIYNLNIGTLCKAHPTYFSNLTEPEKLCHQVTLSDIESHQKRFCDDKKEEFLDYVKNGLLKCEIVNKKFQSIGCGQLQCN